MTNPNLVFNVPAMIVAAAAAFVFGGLYYGPIAGKAWAKAMGWAPDQKPPPGTMQKAMAIQIVGIVLTIWVLSHSNQVWRASVWNAGTDGPGYLYGFFGGLFTWLGFYVPLQMNKVAWEGRPWKLFFINTVHDFINLQILSQILSNWR